MAFLGMQADMQHYPSWDLNLDPDDENNVDDFLKSEEYYNDTLSLPSPEQHLGYKEELKQTMLKHESIFRDQLQELHQLYRRQGELMDEMRSNQLNKHHLQHTTLKSNPILPQDSFEYAQKTCHISSLPWVNSACNPSSVSGAKNNIFPSSFAEGKSIQAGPDPEQTEGSSKDSELLGTKCKKFGKKILDLQLPAEEYIDSEDEKGTEVPEAPSYPLMRVSKDVHKSDKKLSPGSAGFNSVFQENNLTPDSLSPKIKFMTDLNEPINLEGEAAPKSNDFLAPVTDQREIPSPDLSEKSNSSFQVLSKEILQNTERRSNHEACSDILHPEKNGKQPHCLSYDDEAGHGRINLNSTPQGFYSEKVSPSFEHFELKQADELPASCQLDQTNQKSCSERNVFGLASFERDLSSSSYPGPAAASYKHNSNQLASQADVANSESSMVSSWRKHNRDLVRTPIVVQALPCFKTAASSSKSSKASLKSPGFARDKFRRGKSLKSSLKIDSASSFKSSFCSVSQSVSKTLEAHLPSISFDGQNCSYDNDLSSENHGHAKNIKGSMDVKDAKSVNLKFMSPSCSIKAAPTQCIQTSEGEKKPEDSTGELPRLKAKPVPDEKPNVGSKESAPVESVVLQANSACVVDVESTKVEASESSGGKELTGFPLSDKPYVSNDQHSSHSSPYNTLQRSSHSSSYKTHQNSSSEKDRVLVIDLECDPMLGSGEQPTANEPVAEDGLSKKISGFAICIDLNSCIGEDESSPMSSLSTELDLKAPASPENKESSPPRGESDENQLETPVKLSEQEDGDLQEELVKIAAEAMVSLSSSGVQASQETTTCLPSESSQSNSLQWFAKVVLSVVDDPESEVEVVLSCKDGGNYEEYPSDASDYFEVMTLKLTETKVEEYRCESNGQKEEEAGAASLPCEPKRRTRTRSVRQQRKDFQSEILPSLVSLSRYEVTEDLQTIGGLIEAASSKQNAGSTRNVGRNVWARKRKRRQLSVSSSNVTERTVSLPLKRKTNKREMGIEERNQITWAWGNITRRRSGQRCPASNPGLILGRV